MNRPTYKHLCMTLALMLIGILTSSGCSVMRWTDADENLRTPEHQNRSPEPSPIVQGQPLTSGAPLSLAECVSVGLQNNPDLASRSWEASSAEARSFTARASLVPRLSAEGGYQRFLDPQRLVPATVNSEPGVFDDDIFNAGLVLKIPLFAGGRYIGEIQAADLMREAAAHRLARTQQELTFNISSTYFSILAQERLLSSLEFSRKVLDEQLAQTKLMVETGRAAGVDALKIEVRLAEVRQSIVRESNILLVQRRLLLNQMGIDRDPNTLVLAEQELQVEATPPETPAFADVLAGREDYLAARREMEAQARRVDSALAGYWPSLDAMGTYGLRADAVGNDEEVGYIGVGVSIPLLDLSRNVAAVREERATLGLAQSRLRSLESQIRLEYDSAISDLQSALERNASAKQAVSLAQEVLRIEREKYSLGRGAITDLLQAESALLQAETNYFRSITDCRTATARVTLLIGDRR